MCVSGLCNSLGEIFSVFECLFNTLAEDLYRLVKTELVV